MDSTAATVTEAVMVENAVAMRDAGCSLDETVTWLEAEKVTNQIFFTVGNLDYLIRDFTDSGHFITIIGYDRDGFIINDSNSRTNSKKRWSYEQLSRQMRNLWAMYN